MRLLCLLVVVSVGLQHASSSATNGHVGCSALERYVACPNSCDRDDCSMLVDKRPCDPVTIPCKGRCMCKDGYFRKEGGDCVPGGLCFKSCATNEEWDDCPDSCDDKLCPVDGIEVACRPGPPGECIGRCVCSPDFYRDSDGNCVSKDVCVKCQSNEVWDPSPNECNDLSCRSANSTCIVHQGRIQKGKCVCEEGYYRNLNVECTSKEDCAKCTNNHEVFGCGSACDTTCATLTKRCPIINIVCNQKCYCQIGYARDKNNVCIPANKCNTKNSCKANEEFLTDGTACEVTCANQNLPMLCTDQLVAGCFCLKGYIRNESGDCIEPEKCPVVCNDNEEWKDCPNSCDDVQCPIDGLEVQCQPGPTGCLSRCVCQAGYFRNREGKCVSKDACAMQCNWNEVWNPSPNNCNDQSCSSVNTECVPNERGEQGRCVCADGYYRNLNGQCASKEDCLKCTIDHEVFGCGSACDTKCATFGKPCPIVNIVCNEKCYCQNGYAKDNNNVCIPVQECTTENSCPPKEVFSTCGTACEETCANRGESILCTEQCVVGCFCEKGLVRNASGVCVEPAQCPPDPTCGNNEEYKCRSRCAVTCQSRYQQYLAGTCAPGCTNSCYCKEGFLRNKNSLCVPEDQCDVECDRNEEWRYCPPQCADHTCETLDSTPNCSLILPQVCREGCVCAPGFYRNVKGFCVSKQECVNQCGSNENYVTCLACPPLDCESLYTSYDCNLSKRPCTPGCECANGYLRDFKNICVLGGQCPAYPQCGDNEHYTRCGSKCENTCDNPQRTCTPRCIPGCVCDEGYIRDKENGKCILVTECTNECDASAHEVFAPCKSICPPQECGVRPELILCLPQPCVPGCDCEQGFLRAKRDGPCIPKSECPAPQCKVNEEYSPCIYKCPPQTCWSILADIICDLNQTCAPGCKCIPGYLRLDSGLCVPSDQCPQSIPECGDNEQMQECPVDCPTDNCVTEITPIPQCLPPFPCQPAKCKCIASYKRNEDGLCVPSNECPCNKNETFNECGCDKKCLGKEIDCDGQCLRGCFCSTGFVRDENGVCILEKDCPNC